MGRYDDLINNLVMQVADLHVEDEYFITLYIPFDFTNIAESKKRIKSVLLDKLRDHRYLRDYPEFHKTLVNTVNNYIDEVPIEGKGIALFIKTVVSEVLSGKEKHIPQENIILVPLYVEFEEYAGIEKVFNVDQLAWINSQDKEVLVITLEVKNTILYVYRKGILEEIKEMSKAEWDFTKPKQSAKVSPSGAFSSTFGTNEDKLKRFDIQTVGFFVDDMLEDVAEELRSGIEEVIIYYSNEFTPFIEDIREYIKDKFNIQSTTILKSLQNKEILLENVLEVLKDERKQWKYDQLEKARAAIELFVSGWEDVADMCRDGRIHMLFVQTDMSAIGYIRDGLIYVKDVEDSIMVDDIYPWIVRNVVLNGGDIVIFRDEEKENIREISASLRYSV